jgi:hypothetical protein
MERTRTLCGLCIAFFLCTGMFVEPGDMPAQTPPADIRDTPISLEKGIDRTTRLVDVLEFLSERTNVTVNLDTAAFRAAGTEAVENQLVALPRIQKCRLETVVWMLARQVGGGVDSRNQSLTILPEARIKAMRLEDQPPPGRARAEKELKAKLESKVSYEKGIDKGTRLSDLLEFLAERHEVIFFVDEGTFADKDKRVGEKRMDRVAPIKERSLSSVLKDILDQQGLRATYQIRGEVIVIRSKKSAKES